MPQLNSEERKSIEELIAQYYFEPKLKDIYVEGWYDKCFIEWFIESCGISDISVYDIEAVDVPDKILVQHGLQQGSYRAQVIALSRELDSGLPRQSPIICIIDRDYDDYISSNVNGKYLIVTDYNSLESYAIDKRVIFKFIKLVLNCDLLSIKNHISVILGICEDLFFFRLANICLEWNMSWIDATRLMQIKGGEIIFNKKKFIERYLQSNGKWSQRSEYFNEVDRLRSITVNDVRRKIRGHDFTEFFFTVIRRTRSNRKFGNLETFQGALLACVEREHLMNHNLFKTIVSL